jgi:U32 family peptidase
LTDKADRRLELLAPAGDEECLRAAVANGADAVYFGLEDFNARRRAANFTLARLPAVIGFLHRHNVKGYVALNTLIFSDELEKAAQFIAGIAAAGADAVIVQDLGLARLIREMAPSLPIHASTQMTQTHPLGIEMLRELGVRRVILARELSVEEIGQIARATTMELEVFVHGAMCISYSGQCLASESLWGRSANRGVCAQACRLPYQLVIDGQACDTGKQTYLLSAKDLAAYDRIADLVHAGVTGFKIEGRLKSAHYVAAATGVYRAALDAAVAGRAFELSRQQKEELIQSFSRGFTRGFLDGNRHQDLVDGRFPKTRGVLVGIVASKSRRGIVVEIKREAGGAARSRRLAGETGHEAGCPLKPGDGVVFDEGHPERDEQGGRVYSVEPLKTADACIELTFGQGDVSLPAVEIGSKVWKTDDPAIRRRLESTYRRRQVVRRVPLTVRGMVTATGRLRIVVSDDAGHEASAESAEPMVEAQRHPLTDKLLAQQCGRLGDTPFELASAELVTSSGPVQSLPFMAPKSVLNDLRRQAVQRLLEVRERAAPHEVARPTALEGMRAAIREAAVPAGGDRPACPTEGPRLCVLARQRAQLDVVLDWVRSTSFRTAVVYCDSQDEEACREAMGVVRAAGLPVGLVVTRVCKPGEERVLRRMADLSPDAFLVRNLAALRFLREQAPRAELIGDFSLNAVNELSTTVLTGGGLSRLTPGYDANLAQLAALRSRCPSVPLEIVIHQHVPLFHLAHCVLAARRSRAEDCRQCTGFCEHSTVHLRDRKGADHPMLFQGAGRATVFNGAVQSAADLLPRLTEMGISFLRIELLDESPEQTRGILGAYGDLLREQVPPAEAMRRLKDLCRCAVGHGTFDFA